MIHTNPLFLLSLHKFPPGSCCTCLLSLYLYPIPLSGTSPVFSIPERTIVLCPRTRYRVPQDYEYKSLTFISFLPHPQMARSRR